MTAKELAEAILKYVRTGPAGLEDTHEGVDRVESILSSALEEAKKEAFVAEITGMAAMADISEEMRKTKAKEAIDQIKAVAYVQGSIDGFQREESKWFKRGMEAAYEECAKIADGICSTCPDEDGDCCPASNHSAAKTIRQRAKELK